MCAAFLWVQTMVWLPLFGIYNMRADTDACNCPQWLYRHLQRVCTESWPRVKSPSPRQGPKPASVLCLGISVGRSTNWALSIPLCGGECFTLTRCQVWQWPKKINIRTAWKQSCWILSVSKLMMYHKTTRNKHYQWHPRLGVRRTTRMLQWMAWD